MEDFTRDVKIPQGLVQMKKGKKICSLQGGQKASIRKGHMDQPYH